MAKEITKQVFDINRRIERATQFLVTLTDMLEGRIDPFERTLIKLLTDEYIEIFGELNKKKR